MTESSVTTVTVDLMQRMPQAMLTDRPALIKRIKQLELENTAAQTVLAQDIQASIERAELRRIRFENAAIDINLPIADKAQDIIDSIRNHQVTIVAGATGSGKTTQLPKLCLQAGLGSTGTIGHTQPRRIAARATATRIASELNTKIGEGVGYKVRFSDQTGDECQIKLVTDGMLLQEAHNDRQLLQYDCLIIDEAHERSLNIDFLMGLLKPLLKKRPQLRVIITSATINPEEFSEFFDGAPIIEVSGRSYPIEVHFDAPEDRPMDQHVADAIELIWRDHGKGDVLVFLPGEREIRDAEKMLKGRLPGGTQLLPLFARLPVGEQNAVFTAGAGTRVVLATNVAETSLTVPGIKYVVDSGVARISRYHYKSKMQRLAIEPISQASANQRAGRCGRTQAGVCLRLYAEDDFEARVPFTDPEIVRTNLASVILRMAVLGIGPIERFAFINLPDRRFIKDGFRLLQQLQAFSERGRVTKLGRSMAMLPLDPRLARVVVAAVDDGCLAEMQVIAAGLSAGDPRERPQDKQQAADERHQQFIEKDSDFLSLINIWRGWKAVKGGQRQQRNWCKKNFLSFRRLREWHDIVLQIQHTMKELHQQPNKRPANTAQIHTCLLRGFVDYIGQRKLPHVFTGAHGREFKIFPGSALAKKPPNWVMAAEIVQTSQVFARQVAQIQPAWVEKAASHLVRHRCIDEFWNKQSGQAMGVEETSLYGFVLSRNRRVPLARHSATAARMQFIQQALVADRWEYDALFVQENKRRRNELAHAESRLRTILLDEGRQYDAFDALLPDDVVDRKSFARWWKSAEQDNPSLLILANEQIGDDGDARSAWYPQNMKVAGQTLTLDYLFDPSEERDGVTLLVPAPLLGHLKKEQIEWLIPGWLKSKAEHLFKSLPKSLRKQLVPVTDCAQAFLVWAIDQQLPGGTESLRAALSRFVGIERGVEVKIDDWALADLPPWLNLGVAVIDENGDEFAWSRQLDDLRVHAQSVMNNVAAQPNSEWLQQDVRQWSFDDLPDTVPVDHAGMTITACPILVDKRFRVDLELVPTLDDASARHRDGVLRLLQKNLPDKIKYLQKNLPDLNRMSVLYLHIGEFDQLFDDLIMAALAQLEPEAASLRQASQFAVSLDRCRQGIISAVQALSAEALVILTLRQQISMQLTDNTHRLKAVTVQELQEQLNALVCDGFVRTTPSEWLSELPRYLQAIERRMAKLSNGASDPPAAREVQQHTSSLQAMDAQQLQEFPEYRWMLEEWRVSIFAQELGTRIPVSQKRIARYLSAH